MIIIDEKFCPQDHACPLVKMCPNNAITQEGYNVPSIDHDKCIRCNICVQNCPYKAFKEIK